MRLMPTSITAAPGFTIVGRDDARARRPRRRGCPRRACAARGRRVREWQIVTVAFACMQQHRHRLADELRAAEHDRARALDRHVVLARAAPSRRAASPARGRRGRGRAPPALSGWKPSTSLTGSIVGLEARLVELRRQRHLDEHAVDRVVGVELGERARAPRSSSTSGGQPAVDRLDPDLRGGACALRGCRRRRPGRRRRARSRGRAGRARRRPRRRARGRAPRARARP